jgi:integrase
MVALPALVSGLDAELVRLGCKDSTMVWYRGCWRRLQKYFAARGAEEVSLDAAMAWVDQACGGFFGKEQAGTLKPNDIYMFRVAAMLGEYAAHGAVLRRYNRPVSKLDGPGAEAAARFQARLRAAGLSASTVRTCGTLAGELVAFTGTRGGLACCDANMIGAFAATLAGCQFKTVGQKLCAVRSFLRFASGDGLVDGACLEAVPAARPARQARIPPVRDPGEVTRIPDAVDRDNPCGKRDYAIILLIARPGLRGVDIRRLELADFDWVGNRLLAVQAKTGDRVQLPLLKEAGRAVIDCIRHGRPDSDCPQVFVWRLAPVGPFSGQEHLHGILVRHARVAHVPVSEKRRHGMHSLRHTLAARLMEGGTPAEQIAGIPGHQSVRPAGVYLESSLGLLSKCALGPEAPAPEVSRCAPPSRWPARSRPWLPRNAPRVISMTPGSGCWPGSPRSAPASFPGWRRLTGPRPGPGSRRHGSAGSSRRPCTAWPRRCGSWPAGQAGGACRPTSCPAERCPGPHGLRLRPARLRSPAAALRRRRCRDRCADNP